MSVTSQTAYSGPYLITGLPQTIPVGFPFQQVSDIIVYDGGANGTTYNPPLVLTLGSDYTVIGGGYDTANQMQTGSITVVSTGVHSVAVNDYLFIARNVPINQTTTFSATGPLTIQQVEQALDKTATLSQQVNNGVFRSLRFQPNETIDGTLPGKLTRANMLLGFDAAGAQALYSPLGAGASAVGAGYGISVSGNIISAQTAVVAAIADLKAISVASLTTGTQINVSGYYTNGDGGGGLFWYNSASSASDNGGTVIQPNVGSGRWIRILPSNWIDVRQFGAKGDGSTDDITAINNAIGALPSTYGTLFFPPGKYRFNSTTPTTFSNKSNLTLTGFSAELYNTNHGNTFVFDSTCTKIWVNNLRFTGDASVRASGIHIRTQAGDTVITSCYFQGCSDFGVFVGYDSAASRCYNVNVENNIFERTLGDGVHIMNAANVNVIGNTFFATGDDSIAVVADNPATQPGNVLVEGNRIISSGFRGIAVLEATDVAVVGNAIDSCVAAGIELGRSSSTTAYNARITVTGNKLFSTTSTAGPLGSIGVYFSNSVLISGNEILAPVNGNGIAILDCNDLTVNGNYLKTIYRGIATDDSTTSHVASTWNRIAVTNNMVATTTNEGIYIKPAVGITINNILVTGNTATGLGGSDFVTWDRTTTGRIYNNTNDGGKTYTAGGTVTGVTSGNNN